MVVYCAKIKNEKTGHSAIYYTPKKFEPYYIETYYIDDKIGGEFLDIQ